MMAELEALEKLRAWVRCVHGVERVNSTKTCANLDANAIEHANVLFNDLEAEIASDYIRLPVDADGVPIHMGDTVEGKLVFDDATVKGTVTTYHIHDNDEPDTVYIKVDCGNGTWTIKELRIKRCRHVKPRTLEDVIEGAINAAFGNEAPFSAIVKKAADEIRELLGFEIDEPDTIRNELEHPCHIGELIIGR